MADLLTQAPEELTDCRNCGRPTKRGQLWQTRNLGGVEQCKPCEQLCPPVACCRCGELFAATETAETPAGPMCTGCRRTFRGTVQLDWCPVCGECLPVHFRALPSGTYAHDYLPCLNGCLEGADDA